MSADARLAAVLRGGRQAMFSWPRVDASATVLAGQARAAGWRCVELDTSGVVDKAQFLSRFSEALTVPEWFGHNWDALDESVRDLEVAEGSGLLLLWENWSDFAAGDPDAFSMALEILRDACVVLMLGHVH